MKLLSRKPEQEVGNFVSLLETRFDPMKKEASLALIKAVHELRSNPARSSVEYQLKHAEGQPLRVTDVARRTRHWHYTIVLDVLKNLQITGKADRTFAGWLWV